MLKHRAIIATENNKKKEDKVIYLLSRSEKNIFRFLILDL